jgi:hypothetical protein
MIRRRVTLSLLSLSLVAYPASANAPSGRYTVSNGTVTDTRTKLTWQQATAPGTYTWANAKTYCSGLALNGSGWRLPTIKELMTLVDSSQTTAPFIDTSAFPSTQSNYYWTLTVFTPSNDMAWQVEFLDGSMSQSSQTSAAYVRCVR